MFASRQGRPYVKMKHIQQPSSPIKIMMENETPSMHFILFVWSIMMENETRPLHTRETAAAHEPMPRNKCPYWLFYSVLIAFASVLYLRAIARNLRACIISLFRPRVQLFFSMQFLILFPRANSLDLPSSSLTYMRMSKTTPSVLKFDQFVK